METFSSRKGNGCQAGEPVPFPQRSATRIDTIERIAKALDVSIKSLFKDPDAIEGFVSVRGKLHRINRRAEFERVVKESRPKMEVHWTSTSNDSDDDGGLPF